MRLPEYYWTKDINHKFMCDALQSKGGRYDTKDIINNLPEIKKKEDKHPTDKSNNNTIVSLSGSDILTNDKIKHIKMT